MANQDTLVIDLSNYKDRVGQRVPADRYRVVVEDAEPDTSSNGNPMINLWFRVLDGDYADAVIVDRITLTEKSLFRAVGFMQAIGLPTPKKRVALRLQTVIGKVLEIDVEDGEPYMGRVKSEVRGYLRTAKSGGAAAPADLEDLGSEEEPSGLDEFAAPAEEATAPAAKAEELKERVAATNVQTNAAETTSPWGGGDDVMDLDEIEL